MDYKITDLVEKESIVLDIYKDYNENHLKMSALIIKHLDNTKILIKLGYTGTKLLNFDNVNVDVYKTLKTGTPVVWRNAKIIRNKKQYILCVTDIGVKTNRRSSYRVSIGTYCWLSSDKYSHVQTLLKDLSLSGFSITNRKDEITFEKGDKVSIIFDDLIFNIKLEGYLVRTDKHDNYTVYGFAITNLCKDLAAYINIKQTRR